MAKYFESFGGGVYASGSKYGAAVKISFSYSDEISKLLNNLSEKQKYAVAKAIDEVGNKTRTQVVRALVKQTGVKYGRIKAVMRTKSAMSPSGDGAYMIIARDSTMSLKEFSPRRTFKGVSANPWGTRRVFPHTFIGPNGHVFVRTWTGQGRAKRLPISKLFGPAIPKEMVKDEAERTFFTNVETLLPAAVEKWLMRQK